MVNSIVIQPKYAGASKVEESTSTYLWIMNSHTAKILVHRSKTLPALPLALIQYLARPIIIIDILLLWIWTLQNCIN